MDADRRRRHGFTLRVPPRLSALPFLVAALAAPGFPGASAAPAAPEGEFQPVRVTEKTRADRTALAALERPGTVFFSDDFESPESIKKYFEVRGEKEGLARIVFDPKVARSGKGAFQFTAPARDGKESGVGAVGWFGPEGHDRVHFRRYIRFAPDYDQGNLHHVGGGLSAVAGSNKWAHMGSAGLRPKGDDYFNSSFEPWKDWGRLPPPGRMFLYTYWMDMKRDKDGHYWGNNLEAGEGDRLALDRNRWYCLEHMIRANDAGKPNGELAAWIDGKLYIHYTGFRWRSAPDVKLKRFSFGLYVHQAARVNTVWYDDVALSTGYIGPAK